MTIRKIMVATDGSPPAEAAAKFLAHLPHDQPLELTLVYAMFVPEAQKSYLMDDWKSNALADQHEEAQRAFAAIENFFTGADVQIEQVIREGEPGEVIAAVAKEIEAELIVIGATGHSALERLVLGSTSDYVATRAPCSVLVIRTEEASSVANSLKIAVAYDDEPPARLALQEAMAFDWGSQVEIDVVSVVHGLASEEPHPMAAISQRAAKSLRKVTSRTRSELLFSDDASAGLVDYVERGGHDIVILGETPRGALSKIFLTDTTRYVLRHAGCSVWVARNPSSTSAGTIHDEGTSQVS